MLRLMSHDQHQHKQASKWSPLSGAALGFLLGALVGALARWWMRLIATDTPEFSWSGTFFIIMIFAFAGLLSGLVVGARRRGWVGTPMAVARLFGILATVILSMGQGMLMAAHW
jgi:apolipoprotein N-acyltransferase